MARNPEDQFAAALAHQLKGPVASMQAASTNIRRNLRGMLEDLGTLAGPAVPSSALAAFVARAVDDPAPRPLTGLLPQDRLMVIARRLRDAGVEGDLEQIAATLLRGGWDTDMEEIAPLLAREPAAAIEILDSAGRLRANLGVIEESLRRVRELASTLRLLGLPGTGPATDLRRGIETAAAAVLQEAPQGVVISTSVEGLPAVAGSGELLGEVWANLIRNALQAVGDAGTIRIEGETRGRGSARQGVVRFIDDGPGIPPVAMSRLFEPLFTTRTGNGGTGMGLAIARRIVEGLGGAITVESRPGLTCFEVSLPAAVAEHSRR